MIEEDQRMLLKFQDLSLALKWLHRSIEEVCLHLLLKDCTTDTSERFEYDCKGVQFRKKEKKKSKGVDLKGGCLMILKRES